MFADRPLRVAAGPSCASEEDALIAVRDLRAFYGSSEVLHGVDTTVCAKRCIALVGESGSGKTTLARAIAGIHPGKHRGRYPVQGAQARTRLALAAQGVVPEAAVHLPEPLRLAQSAQHDRPDHRPAAQAVLQALLATRWSSA